MAHVEKTAAPEETSPEPSLEPEPVFIDEVQHFLCAYVSTDLSSQHSHGRNPNPLVQGKMDRTLALLQNADPAVPTPDSPELIQLEGIRVNAVVNPVAQPVTAEVFLLCISCAFVSFPNLEYLF